MSPLNRLINSAAEMSQSRSLFERFVKSRATSFAAGIPFELLAMLQNILALPVSTLMFSIKIPVKVINLAINSQSLKEFEMSIPDLLDIFKTALKIVGYALGMLLTISLGVISPYANFRLHVALELVSDIKADRIRRHAEREKAKQLEAQSRAMRSHVQQMILKLRMEALQKENPHQKAEKTAS